MQENNQQSACGGCRRQLAIASVPMQRFEQLYPVAEGWRRGTLFAALDLPLCPKEDHHELYRT